VRAGRREEGNWNKRSGFVKNKNKNKNRLSHIFILFCKLVHFWYPLSYYYGDGREGRGVYQ